MTGEMTDQIEILDPEECWRLLSSASLGRMAVVAEDGIDIYPMNYTVHDGAVYIRSAPGHKMIELTKRPTVAFEADGVAGRLRWSVVVHGAAHRLALDSEIEESGVLALRTQSPREKWNYVRIDPTAITGRRFRTHTH